VVIALAAIVATRSADAQCGEPGAGDCFSANGTPGCASLDCCKTVCAIIPFCCEVGWDETCADAAVTFCTCGSPISGDCFTPNSSPGCDDAECCETVCAIDPFCCDGDWDGLCVLHAEVVCRGCGSMTAGDCFEPNGTPGCQHFACCDQVCTLDPGCCESGWDELCAAQAADICCLGDVDGNGAVDVDDLVSVITGWGPCGDPTLPCRADTDASGEVDVDDLVTVILQWGPCGALAGPSA
jgi:hypothetical protein